MAHKRHQIVKMMYLVVIIIEMSHDTFQSSVNYHNSDRGVLYRSKIGNNVEEISHTCYFGLGNATVLTAMKMVVWVLWGEIKVDFNDLKHTVHLIRGCYGLGNTTTTCNARLSSNLESLKNELKWNGTEVGTNVGSIKSI